MKSRQLLAIALLTFMGGSVALAVPRHAVRRGEALVIETQFAANVRVQQAFLNWQAFDPVSPQQKGMATAFRGDADVVARDSSVERSCEVPLDVADGTYYLTLISVRMSDFERKYSWQGDWPTEIEIQIRGGEEQIAPI